MDGGLVLIVTGAHLRAEAQDRPTAYALRQKLAAAMLASLPEGDTAPTILVCSDLWYLNTAELRQCPTVSIGAPEVNALAAYLTERLPAVFTIDGRYTVQLELDGSAPIASCWGVDHALTEEATRVFVEKCLAVFAEAASRVCGH